MSAHSRFGASSAYRWMACPASVKREVPFPNVETEYAAEGTLLHDAAAAVLTRDKREALKLAALTPEQRDVVSAYVNVVRDEIEAAGPGALRFIEHRFSIKGVHEEFYGTADAVVFHPLTGRLRVMDLKCGGGVPVEVDIRGLINPQLGYYALGALSAAGYKVAAGRILPGRHPLPTDIEIIVVQPRAGGVKRRKVALIELEDLAVDLRTAAIEADSAGPGAQAGKHCKFCRARGVCPDLRTAAMEAAKAEFGKVDTSKLDDARDMTPEELAEALRSADILELWIKGVRDHARNVLGRGAKIPGWKLVERMGNRKWQDGYDPAELASPLNMAPEDLCEAPKPLSPAQAEKVLKSWGHDPKLVDQYTTRQPGMPALVREADPRKALKNSAGTDFTPADEEWDND